MKKSLILLIILIAVSCQQELEPNVENINSIFETQDFQIRFTLANGDEYRMGFLNNEMAFFSLKETIRRELSYKDAQLINTFVEVRFRESELELELELELESEKNATVAEPSQIEIYNDSKKVVFRTANYTEAFEQLLIKMNLPYVSTKKK